MEKRKRPQGHHRYASSTVYDVVKAFKAFGNIWDQEKDADLLSRLKAIGNGQSRDPMSVLAKKRNVSWSTVSRAVKELNTISYKWCQAHLLTGKMKEVRLRRCKKVLNSLKSGTSPHLKFFSDEKIFTVDRSSNRQNDRWLAKTEKEVPNSFKTKNPASVMVLGVVSTAGDAGEEINIDVYLGVLKEVVKPWMDEKASGDVYNGNNLFQQDSAPAHKTKKTQEWLQANTWPSNSPDLNPMDYYMQASKLPAADVTAACKGFKSRIEAVIAAEGGHIE
ncbi:Transposable element tcb2 transposase [Caligus rogercresseyi]|uniref:Transposable element tcb2 transposase n=1 Tax=Caligus rogercresseyi TaxID=217165 RepID=A0A7T8KEF9_CALRO|nr:Transposable element tcb2 transposase [Caligus rogercresseyi]